MTLRSAPARPDCQRACCAWLACIALVSAAAPVCAEGEGAPAPPPMAALSRERPIFEYTSPVHPRYVRTAVEEVVLLGLGFAQYVANHDLNSQDWDFGYTWSGLRDKLSPRGYSFDTNGFDTNFVRHPAAGTTYYWAARANRLTMLESLATAMIASTFWEYIGELRERASLNDILVTPLTGMVLGEMTIQLGAFFDRSCDSAPNRLLGGVLGPVKSFHDVLDSAYPLRERRCDRYGLSRRGAHSFELSITSGALSTGAGPSVPLRSETRLLLHTQILALDTYGAAGEGAHHFIDGNVTELWLQSSFADAHWNDFTLRATVMPLGLHYRAIAADRAGLRGSELLFGLLTGAEYSVHRFGVWPEGDSRLRDRYFELDLPGASLGYRMLRGETVFSVELQASVAFVAVDALALPAFRALGATQPLPAVTRADGYNYALGVRLQPRASVTHRGLAVGADLAAVRVQTVTIADRFDERQDYVTGNERRTLASAWLRIGPQRWPVRLTLQADWLQRWGALARARAQRTELSTRAGIMVVF